MIACLLVSALLAVGAHAVPVENARIVGGTDATRGEFPMMVSIRYKDEHHCGGTILDELHILTAGQCIVSGTAYLDRFSVQYGILDLTESENVVAVAKMENHPNFTTWQGIVNDLAVITLATPIKFSELVQPVKLPEAEGAFKSSDAVLAGWGFTMPLSGSSTRLQKTTMDVKPDEYCLSHNWGYKPVFNMCTDKDTLAGMCFHDTGGPVFVDGTQQGIMSFRDQPCQATYHPTVATKVAHYLDWIKQFTQ